MLNADEIIGNYEGWLYKVAGQILSPTDSGLEDLVQEGRVALWQALESWDASKGAQPSWLTTKARYRMVEVATGKRYTGQPKRLHGGYGAEEPKHMRSLDEPIATHGGTAAYRNDVTLADTVPDPSNLIDRADMAAHRGEIAAARRNLTPAQQRYVAARFYGQLSDREMVLAGLFSYDPHALWTSVKNGARGKLANELAHLREVEG